MLGNTFPLLPWRARRRAMHSMAVGLALLLVLVSTCNVEADAVVVDKLVCRLTSEKGGLDRIRLEYQVDGGKVQKVRHDMRRGDMWSVGKSITFERTLRIEVFEKDRTPFNRDEKLGSFTIAAESIGDGEAKTFVFDKKGGNFWLAIGKGEFVSPESPEPLPPRQKPAPKPTGSGSVLLQPQAGTSPIQYVGPPPIGVNGSTLTAVSLPPQYPGGKMIVNFLTSSSGIVQLTDGETASPEKMKQLFGTATPRLPVSFVAYVAYFPANYDAPKPVVLNLTWKNDR